jgi:hypothetical protein
MKVRLWSVPVFVRQKLLLDDRIVSLKELALYSAREHSPIALQTKFLDYVELPDSSVLALPKKKGLDKWCSGRFFINRLKQCLEHYFESLDTPMDIMEEYGPVLNWVAMFFHLKHEVYKKYIETSSYRMELYITIKESQESNITCTILPPNTHSLALVPRCVRALSFEEEDVTFE